MIKVNINKTTDWITSFDYLNSLDDHLKAMTYDKYIYISIGSLFDSVYYSLAQVNISSGEVIKTISFKAINNVYLAQRYFRVNSISDKYIITMQNNDYLNTNITNFFVVDRSTLNPILKIEAPILYNQVISYWMQNEIFYIFGANFNKIQIISIDSNLQISSITKVFESSASKSNDLRLRTILQNNTFIIAESLNITDSFNNGSATTVFHKINLNFETSTCETFTMDDSPLAFQIVSNLTGILNNTDKKLTYTYIKSKILNFSFFLDFTLNVYKPENSINIFGVYDFTKWIWPRYSIYSNKNRRNTFYPLLIIYSHYISK